jgi:hypothetical protein
MYFFIWHNYDIASTFFIIYQVGNCNFFDLADNKMSTYEKRIMQWLKDIEAQTQAKIGRLKKLIETELVKYKTEAQTQIEVGGLEKLIDTKLAK